MLPTAGVIAVLMTPRSEKAAPEKLAPENIYPVLTFILG
jgi:hypothetical protein